ncbi:MAG: hypothetical protein EXR43_02335 [Dehalococcoidia bacterium]|nr:hypothetical protein [Dehalococcoidia bacterium]
MLSWFTWWALSLVISAVATPFAVALLPRFRGGGYAFARPLGVLILGYLYWLGSTARVLPNSRLGVALALLGLAMAAVTVGWRWRAAVRSALVGDRAFVLAVEALFLLAFAAAAFLRSYVPEIAATEKPMEFGFFNAVLRADHFPPGDPWLAGSPISYYYFGYVLLAAVTHLAGTAASVAFNLGLAFTFALAAVAIFGLGAELVSRAGAGRRLARPLIFGTLAVGLALVLANLEGGLELGAAQGWLSPRLYDRLGIDGLSGLKATEHWYPDEFWWWWRATRIVPATITEFPFFSFLLGDLHPHVMAIPFRFLLLAIGGAVLMGDWQPGFDGWRRHPFRLLIVALILGTMGPLSTWDLPAMIALLFGAALLRGLRAGAAAREALAKGVAFVAAPLLLGTVALLPFWLSIDNPGWGPRAVRGDMTRPDDALLLWAPLGVIVLAFTLGALRRGSRTTALRHGRLLATALAIAVAPAIVWAGWIALADGAGGLGTAVGERGVGWITDGALMAIVAATVLALGQHARPGGDGGDYEDGPASLALLAALLGWLLILGVEFFYLDDILHSRLNSVFKLSFQGWLLLAAAAGYGLYDLLGRSAGRGLGRVGAVLAGGILAVVLAGGLVYPVTAMFARTDGFGNARTLDGLAWLREEQPEEARAQAWLRANSEQGDVMLESYGDAYTEAGRVSSRTGTPTLLGWWIHEINWRGDRPEYAERAQAVEDIYRSADLARVEALLRRYGVRWVYVGALERSRYTGADLDRFGRFMDVAYREGNVTIYRRRGDGR